MKITNFTDIHIDDTIYRVLRDNRHCDGTITFSTLKVTGIDKVENAVRTADLEDNDKGWEHISLFEII